MKKHRNLIFTALEIVLFACLVGCAIDAFVEGSVTIFQYIFMIGDCVLWALIAFLSRGKKASRLCNMISVSLEILVFICLAGSAVCAFREGSVTVSAYIFTTANCALWLGTACFGRRTKSLQSEEDQKS